MTYGNFFISTVTFQYNEPIARIFMTTECLSFLFFSHFLTLRVDEKYVSTVSLPNSNLSLCPGLKV